MALDMVGQITGMDLFLVERQGRRAVEETARSYQESIDQWKAHSNDLKRKLNIEKCHTAGLNAQYSLIKKLVDENNAKAYLNKTRMVHAETGAQLTLSQLAYCEAYNVKAKELNVPLYSLKSL